MAPSHRSAPCLLAITPADSARAPGIGRAWLEAFLSGQQASGLAAERVVVQLRDKSASESQLRRFAAQAKVYCATVGIRLSINSRFDIARELDLDGVHLPSAQLEASPSSTWPRLVGASCHSVEQVRQAGNLGASYAVLGPIFETPSKRQYGPPLGLAVLRQACDRFPGLPLLAIGGVNAESGLQALRSGASGLAAIRALGERKSAAALCNLVEANRASSSTPGMDSVER